MTFELIWGYGHCFGKTTYHEGRALTEAKARQWVEVRRQAADRPRVPREDPVRTCPVAACPGHRQRPWFGYRPVRDDPQEGA
ncbi:MAG: hypothetical protein JJV98_09650 [Desulfosarcina sp.]|nr:hypothetical protein [Desulfobacterales bacterium]